VLVFFVREQKAVLRRSLVQANDRWSNAQSRGLLLLSSCGSAGRRPIRVDDLDARRPRAAVWLHPVTLIDQMCNKYADFGMVAGQSRSIQMVLAVVWNLQVGPHLDKGDDDNRVVTMSLLGGVHGADLLVGTHGHLYKLAYGPR